MDWGMGGEWICIGGWGGRISVVLAGCCWGGTVEILNRMAGLFDDMVAVGRWD